jgi:hypothetical protein
MSVRLKMVAKAVALAGALGLASGHASAQNPVLKTAMQDKLAHAHVVLEALVAGDFDRMSRSAEALGRISEMEIMTWQSAPTAEYRNQANAFLLSMHGLREAAHARNGGAALRSYLALVTSCAGCHAHVRSARVVSFQAPAVR